MRFRPGSRSHCPSRQIDRAWSFSAPPWQWQGSLLDYELQYEAARPLGRRGPGAQSRPRPIRYSRRPRGPAVDSFYSDRWVFQHQFSPIKASKIRVLVNDVTWGGGATADVVKAGGQTGPHQIMLREVEIYGR